MMGLIGFLLPLLASASPVIVNSINSGDAPIISSANAKEIPDSYIIKFKDHVTARHAADHHNWVQGVHQQRKTDLKKRSQTPMVDDIFSGIKHTYNIAGSMLGYSGHFDEHVIEQIRKHPDVSLY